MKPSLKLTVRTWNTGVGSDEFPFLKARPPARWKKPSVLGICLSSKQFFFISRFPTPYCWWLKSYPVIYKVVYIPGYLQGCIHPRWLFGISAINSSKHPTPNWSWKQPNHGAWGPTALITSAPAWRTGYDLRPKVSKVTEFFRPISWVKYITPVKPICDFRPFIWVVNRFTMIYI